MTPEDTRRWVRWLCHFFNNLPQNTSFDVTDDEADQMVRAFEEDDGRSSAWEAAARIWEAREARGEA